MEQLVKSDPFADPLISFHPPSLIVPVLHALVFVLPVCLDVTSLAQFLEECSPENRADERISHVHNFQDGVSARCDAGERGKTDR